LSENEKSVFNIFISHNIQHKIKADDIHFSEAKVNQLYK
jgi:hypothetical protein